MPRDVFQYKLLAELRKFTIAGKAAVQANAQLERRVIYHVKIPEKIRSNEAHFPPGTLIATDPAFTMTELAEQIKKQVEPTTWKDEKHNISILANALIINQSEATQSKIHVFLLELGITKRQHDENNRPYGEYVAGIQRVPKSSTPQNR